LHSKRALLWTAQVASNYKIYLGLHVKCPIFLPYCNNFFFHSILKSQISYFTETRVGLLGGDESSGSECCTPGELVSENSKFRDSLGGLHGPFGFGDEGNNTPEIPLPGNKPSLFSQ